jgi:hypothetical protein
MGPETIRSRALECLWLAQNTSDPEQKSLLLTMAHSWADLANSVERFQVLAGGTVPTARSEPIIIKTIVTTSSRRPARRSRLH